MKKKRTPGRIANPLALIAKKQPIGEADADMLMFPIHAHLYEVGQGIPSHESSRILTMALIAGYDAATYYGNRDLSSVLKKATEAWLSGSDRSMRNGITDRVALTGDELKSVRMAITHMGAWLPRIEVGTWCAVMENAISSWDRHAEAA